MSAKKKDPARYSEIRNSKALRDYFVDERFEAGIQLRGTEVKSIRAGRAQITDAFGRVEKGELWLHNAHIEQYAFGNINNHEAKRTRKLLLHRHQIRKIEQAFIRLRGNFGAIVILKPMPDPLCKIACYCWLQEHPTVGQP